MSAGSSLDGEAVSTDSSLLDAVTASLVSLASLASLPRTQAALASAMQLTPNSNMESPEERIMAASLCRR
ncbi:MAG TPA: hypothetical protein VGD37_36205 [Kofleriaceae bacterium]